MNDKEKRMKEVFENFQNYVNTYGEDKTYLMYSDNTFIHDMIYGVGKALHADYLFASGYDRFMRHLLGLFRRKGVR